MSDTYADHPKSITELKASKDEKGSTWTPRDALIAALREIDNGMKINMIVIASAWQDEKGEIVTGYRQAYPNMSGDLGGMAAIGLVQKTLTDIARGEK